MFEVIPAIDLLDSKVVRLKQGDYNQVTFYDLTPEDLAKKFEDNGATRIHIVDLDGAKDGESKHLKILEKIRKKVSCTIECGGGIRNQEAVKTLLSIGVNELILGSMLVKDFQLSKTIIETFPNKIIAGIDAKDDAVAVEGWIEKSVLSTRDLIKKLNELPLASTIYTDIKKDGMLNGPNIDHLKHYAPISSHPLIASGGVTTLNDIEQIKTIPNVQGCIVGKAILDNKIKLSEIFKFQTASSSN